VPFLVPQLELIMFCGFSCQCKRNCDISVWLALDLQRNMTFLYAQNRMKGIVIASYRLMETMLQSSYLFLLCDGHLGGEHTFFALLIISCNEVLLCKAH
jgi:hypothetical protein